jgi:flagellar hook-associated protein 3 FlgL
VSSRVANFAQHERNLTHILDAQRRLNFGQLQLSSGRKSDVYAGIASDVRRLVNVESSYVRTNQYIENNKLGDQRLQIMESNVAQVFDTLTKFKTLLVNGLNANNATDLAMPAQAQAMLHEVSALLNVKDDGRYLFSGTRTDTPAVDQAGLPGFYTVPSNDGDAIGYYQGDNVQLSMKADVDFTVTYGVTAGEAGFERAIRSLHLIVIGPPGDRATMEDALDVVSQAISDVSDIRTRIGASRAALENVNKRFDEFQLYSEKTISELENVDITKTITQMNSDQLAVEASFTTLSRLNDLSLTRFLR